MMKHYSTILCIYFCFAVPIGMASNSLNIIHTVGEGDEFTKILQEFGRANGVHINIEFKTQNDLKTSVLTMMELHTSPDAMIMPADHLGLHNFINYSEIDPRIFSAHIPKRILATGISDNKQYGAPLTQGYHLLLYYNKSLVKEPAKNWEDILAQKPELEAKGITTIVWPLEKPYYFLPFLSALGGWPLNNGKIELNTPAMLATLDFFQWLRTNKIINHNCSTECSNENFSNGKSAYIISGDWQGKKFFQSLGNTLGITALPMIDGKKMVPAFSTLTIAFPDNSLTKAKSATLIQLTHYLQSQKVQKILWEKIGAIPVETNAFQFAKKNATGYLQQTLELMDNTKPLPTEQAMSFIWVAIEKGLRRYWEGALNSKQAANYMQQLAERNIRNAQQQIPVEEN